jgi:outer membrane immunogenic protein
MRIILAAAAATLVAGAAVAADLPSRRPPAAAAYTPAPIFTWSGLYFGLNGGGWINNTTTNYGFGSGKLGGGGGLIGGTIGYNWQASPNLVVGVEADVDYRTKTNVTVPFGGSTSTNDGYLGTVRGRVGYSIDRVLLFATGGLAFGSVIAPSMISAPLLGVIGFPAGSSGSSLGWTVGGGVEFAITPNWSVKGEYLYADLGSKVLSYNTLALPVAVTERTAEHAARVGVNYRFNLGGPGGAVRY